MPSEYISLSQEPQTSIEFDTMSTSASASFLDRGSGGGEDRSEDQLSNPDDDSDRSSLDSVEVQAGVKTIEAVSQTWTTWGLYVAYLG